MGRKSLKVKSQICLNSFITCFGKVYTYDQLSYTLFLENESCHF